MLIYVEKTKTSSNTVFVGSYASANFASQNFTNTGNVMKEHLSNNEIKEI